jgi:hypothetical protein
VTLAAAVVIAVAALLPTSASPLLRVLSVLVGLAGVVVTLWALRLGLGWKDFFKHELKHVGPGAWLTAAGLLVIGIGGAIGPQRSKDNS